MLFTSPVSCPTLSSHHLSVCTHGSYLQLGVKEWFALWPREAQYLSVSSNGGGTSITVSSSNEIVFPFIAQSLLSTWVDIFMKKNPNSLVRIHTENKGCIERTQTVYIFSSFFFPHHLPINFNYIAKQFISGFTFSFLNYTLLGLQANLSL